MEMDEKLYLLLLLLAMDHAPNLLQIAHCALLTTFWFQGPSFCIPYHHFHIPIVCIRYSGIGRTFSCLSEFWPKIWNQRLSSERHQAYAHGVLRKEWPQSLICEAPCSECMKHILHIHPIEKEEYSLL